MPAKANNDDLDLDGNWAAGGDDLPEPSSEKASKKGTKRKLLAAAAEKEAEVAKKKKKRKKGGSVLTAVMDSEKAPEAGVGDEDLRQWAVTRVATSWVAEAKASKLTPLEVKEVKPLSSWFVPCSPTFSMEKLPWAVLGAGGSSGSRTFPGSTTLLAARDGKPPPAAPTRGISVLVLCSSTDRVFAVKGEIEKAWKVKALALAAHGGGRKKDQVARQAKALKSGVAIAVATPARMLRLVAEDHLDAKNLRLIVFDLAQDRKHRDVLTLGETRGDFFNLLRRQLLALLSSEAPPSSEGTALLLCGCAAAEPAAAASEKAKRSPGKKKVSRNSPPTSARATKKSAK